MRVIFLVTGLFTVLMSHAEPFRGGHEALIEVTTDWIASDQLIDHHQITVTPPDRRIPINACPEPLSIRFPFINNRKTIEVGCENPKWKRYLRVKIEEKFNAWVFRRDLAEGTQVLDTHIENIPVPDHLINSFLEKHEIVGRMINRDIALGEVVTTDLLMDEISVFVPTRAYEAGEIIAFDDLAIETRMKEKMRSPLTIWPEQTVIAKNALQADDPIQTTDIEIVQELLIAKKTIVTGQVITPDLVELRLEPTSAYGPTPLTNLEEINGLEATRTIRVGQRLHASDFVAADLVRKNETVRLTITRGALKITVETVALGNAKIGQQVLLKNPDSGKEIRGIVTGRNEARGL
jgi:flagella basal body P-ring formation protein FlgA